MSRNKDPLIYDLPGTPWYKQRFTGVMLAEGLIAGSVSLGAGGIPLGLFLGAVGRFAASSKGNPFTCLKNPLETGDPATQVSAMAAGLVGLAVFGGFEPSLALLGFTLSVAGAVTIREGVRKGWCASPDDIRPNFGLEHSRDRARGLEAELQVAQQRITTPPDIETGLPASRVTRVELDEKLVEAQRKLREAEEQAALLRQQETQNPLLSSAQPQEEKGLDETIAAKEAMVQKLTTPKPQALQKKWGDIREFKEKTSAVGR